MWGPRAIGCRVSIPHTSALSCLFKSAIGCLVTSAAGCLITEKEPKLPKRSAMGNHPTFPKWCRRSSPDPPLATNTNRHLLCGQSPSAPLRPHPSTPATSTHGLLPLDALIPPKSIAPTRHSPSTTTSPRPSAHPPHATTNHHPAHPSAAAAGPRTSARGWFGCCGSSGDSSGSRHRLRGSRHWLRGTTASKKKPLRFAGLRWPWMPSAASAQGGACGSVGGSSLSKAARSTRTTISITTLRR